MTANERREQIKTTLQQADEPISATTLARALGVSRQIIVGDVALLRAEGVQIVATPRGYRLEGAMGMRATYVIACRHDGAKLMDELYTVVDNGGGLLDVVVEHALYGQISGQLQIFSRYDADEFLQKLHGCRDNPLSVLTDGVHLHTLVCPNEAVYHRICETLAQKGILFGKPQSPH